MKATRYRTRCTTFVGVLAVLLLAAPFVSVSALAQEKPFPKITPELYDKLNANLDTTWPHDSRRSKTAADAGNG